MTSLHLDLAHEPGSAPLARRAVAAFLREVWPGDDLASTDLVDDAVLVTSELVGNAVRHGLTPVTLDVSVDGHAGRRRVTITCRDGGPWDGSAPSPHGGRGLLLVRGVSEDLQIEGGATSTTVTARLSR